MCVATVFVSEKISPLYSLFVHFGSISRGAASELTLARVRRAARRPLFNRYALGPMRKTEQCDFMSAPFSYVLKLFGL